MNKLSKSARRFFSRPPAGRESGQCSFCGLDQNLVQATIQGLDDVAICVEIIEERSIPEERHIRERI